MVFRPGTDEAGLPLDVWIYLRVEPSTLTAGQGGHGLQASGFRPEERL
jgi:hypothetical protein